MLYSQAWRLLAVNYHLFRGTPSRIWLDWVFAEVFGLEQRLEARTSDHHYDRLTEALATDACRTRALFDRFNIEGIATTEGPLDRLEHHRTIAGSGWGGRVITAYRPDPVIHQAAGRQSPALIAALAAWMPHERWDGQIVDDPMASELAEFWSRAGQSGIARAPFGPVGLFARNWTADEAALVVLDRYLTSD